MVCENDPVELVGLSMVSQKTERRLHRTGPRQCIEGRLQHPGSVLASALNLVECVEMKKLRHAAGYNPDSV